MKIEEAGRITAPTDTDLLARAQRLHKAAREIA